MRGGELARLARGDEARVEARRERAAEDEAARLDADDDVDVLADEALGERVEHDVERARAREQRRDVLEEDPRLGEIGDVADRGAREVERVHAVMSTDGGAGRRTATAARLVDARFSGLVRFGPCCMRRTRLRLRGVARQSVGRILDFADIPRPAHVIPASDAATRHLVVSRSNRGASGVTEATPSSCASVSAPGSGSWWTPGPAEPEVLAAARILAEVEAAPRTCARRARATRTSPVHFGGKFTLSRRAGLATGVARSAPRSRAASSARLSASRPSCAALAAIGGMPRRRALARGGDGARIEDVLPRLRPWFSPETTRSGLRGRTLAGGGSPRRRSRRACRRRRRRRARRFRSAQRPVQAQRVARGALLHLGRHDDDVAEQAGGPRGACGCPAARGRRRSRGGSTGATWRIH